MMPMLLLCATPIGNLGDLTPRVREALTNCSAVYCEDTRRTLTLLNHCGIKKPLVSCYRENELARANEVVGRLLAGETLVYVSDAGMPGISDPGARAADAVRAAGLPVTVVPGPCALSAAVALCGQTESRGFLFEGFLDHKTAARRRRLKELADSACPVVFYESTHRILKLLDEVEQELGPARRLFIARELTKKFEETVSGTPAELRAHYATHSLKGEFVVILLPA